MLVLLCREASPLTREFTRSVISFLILAYYKRYAESLGAASNTWHRDCFKMNIGVVLFLCNSKVKENKQ